MGWSGEAHGAALAENDVGVALRDSPADVVTSCVLVLVPHVEHQVAGFAALGGDVVGDAGHRATCVGRAAGVEDASRGHTMEGRPKASEFVEHLGQSGVDRVLARTVGTECIVSRPPAVKQSRSAAGSRASTADA